MQAHNSSEVDLPSGNSFGHLYLTVSWNEVASSALCFYCTIFTLELLLIVCTNLVNLAAITLKITIISNVGN